VGLPGALIVTTSLGPGRASPDQLLGSVQFVPSPSPVQVRLERRVRDSSISTVNPLARRAERCDRRASRRDVLTQRACHMMGLPVSSSLAETEDVLSPRPARNGEHNLMLARGGASSLT